MSYYQPMHHQAQQPMLALDPSPYLYTFTAHDMEQDPRVPDRFSKEGIWLPPRPFHTNLRTDGYDDAADHNDTCYGYDRENGRLVDLSTPEPTVFDRNMREYSCFSLYYHSGYIWIVYYDASASRVGNGRRGNDEPRYTSDPDGDHDEEDHVPGEWHPLQFTHHEGGSSRVVYVGSQTHLYSTRSDQSWPKRLLPQAYLAQGHNLRVTGQRTPWGALFGELAILIGLVVLAAPRQGDHAHNALMHVIRQHWRRQPERPTGWVNGRGVIVTVYCRDEDRREVQDLELHPIYQ